MQSLPQGAGDRRSPVATGELYPALDEVARERIARIHGAAGNFSPGSARQQREAVLRTLCEPLPSEYARLLSCSDVQWKSLLRWLDTSGLALYVLDRITDLDLCSTLPAWVLRRLRQNLADNTARASGMVREFAVLNAGFQKAGLSFAVLKGFSLWPVSVPKLELRSQLDLDFLIAEASAPQARHILEARGYRLHAISGRTWEFKTVQMPPRSLAGLYKPATQRSVELHLESRGGNDSLLARTELRRFQGEHMPVLAPCDLFLAQGLHVFKHVCGDFVRAAHLIEFRRHILARHHDDAFWRSVHRAARQRPGAPTGLGVAILLISNAMGDFAPPALTRWTVDCLPPGVRLWIELYGDRCLFCNFPGSKLYLLLQAELEVARVPGRRSLRRALLPGRRPPAISHREAGERTLARISRLGRQFEYVMFRLRFHIVEGLRYFCESRRFQRRLKKIR
jgi:hypothetical protein